MIKASDIMGNVRNLSRIKGVLLIATVATVLVGALFGVLLTLDKTNTSELKEGLIKALVSIGIVTLASVIIVSMTGGNHQGGSTKSECTPPNQ